MEFSFLSIIFMPFFYRAFFVLIATGISFPILGTFILNLELVPARFAVMHAALLGGAVALLLGTNPIWTAMAASALVGIIIGLISFKRKVSASGSLGLIMTLSLGIAFIIFYKSNVHAIAAFNLFWGSILALTKTDTIAAFVLSGVIILFLLCARKEIHIVLYDRDLAQAVGVNAKFVFMAILLLVCLGVAVAMSITGALLVDAVTILPALAAREVGKTFKGLIGFSIFFGLVTNMTGFALSFLLDLPVSPAIICSGAVIVFACRFRTALKEKALQKKHSNNANN